MSCGSPSLKQPGVVSVETTLTLNALTLFSFRQCGSGLRLRACSGQHVAAILRRCLHATTPASGSSPKRPAAHRTPCSGRIYDALPPESRTARARLLVPKAGAGLAPERACVLHLAGTGDFTHDRRLSLGAPLVAQARPAPAPRDSNEVISGFCLLRASATSSYPIAQIMHCSCACTS